MSPELVAACIAAAGLALLATAWHMEAQTIQPTTEDPEMEQP